MSNKRERLELAGRWLREQRERRGYQTIAQFAAALGVDQSMVSRYERGVSEVDDERAEQIADVLGLDLITTRRGLGLWVPEPEERTESATGERIPVVVALPDGSQLTYAISRDELARMEPEDRRRLALEVASAVWEIDREEGVVPE